MGSGKKYNKEPKTYAFIDASNLFYGGQKSLGWNIDYKKLADYLKKRYNCKKIYYFGGIETYKYPYNYLVNETVPLDELLKYLRREQRNNKSKTRLAKTLDKYIKRAKFFKKLQKFGYKLILKPVKIFWGPNGTRRLKANCDLDMALCLVKDIEKYERALVLTGDGDFVTVLKHVKHQHRDVIVLARSPRTAKELKHFAGSNFRDFEYLKFKVGMNLESNKNK